MDDAAEVPDGRPDTSAPLEPSLFTPAARPDQPASAGEAPTPKTAAGETAAGETAAGETAAGGPATDRQETPPVPAPFTERDAAAVLAAARKSGVVWVRPAGGPAAGGAPHLAWHAVHEGAVLLVTGVGEQLLPPLHEDAEVHVPAKDGGTRAVSFRARVQVVPPTAPEWEGAVDALRAKRLNDHDLASQRQRWQGGVVVMRLVPVGMLASAPGSADEPSGAAPPPRGPATTSTWRPWHLGGRERRQRRRGGRAPA